MIVFNADLFGSYFDPLTGRPLAGFATDVPVGKIVLGVNIKQSLEAAALSPPLTCPITSPNPGLQIDAAEGTAYYNVAANTVNVSWLVIVEIVAIVIIWMAAVAAFSAPLLTFVVRPLEKVSFIFKTLAQEPMKTLSLDWLKNKEEEEEGDGEFRVGGGFCIFCSGRSSSVRSVDNVVTCTACCWTDEVVDGLETSALIKALLKLATLLRVALGPTGKDFYSAVVSSDSKSNNNNNNGGSSVGGMMALTGVRRSGIYMFCDIRSFTDTTEVLQADVFLWMNKIAGIVHGICGRFDGNAVKHVGDAFLLVWSLPYDADFEEEGGERYASFKSSRFSSAELPTIGEARGVELKKRGRAQSEKCLVAVVKVVAELHMDGSLFEFCSDKAKDVLEAKGLTQVKLGFGIHAGNSIQVS